MFINPCFFNSSSTLLSSNIPSEVMKWRASHESQVHDSSSAAEKGGKSEITSVGGKESKEHQVNQANHVNQVTQNQDRRVSEDQLMDEFLKV